MFFLPRITAHWTSEQATVQFVEVCCWMPTDGKYRARVAVYLPSGFAQEAF